MGVNAAGLFRHILHKNAPRPKSLPANTESLTNEILVYLNSGYLKKAVSLLFASPLPFPFFLYARAFQICSLKHAIVAARKVESHLVTFFPNPPVFLLNRAIETYGKCGCLEDARELFDEMPHRDGGSWNAIITAYAKGECADKSLSIFAQMNSLGVFANEITFASVLGCCGEVFALSLCRQIHGLILKYGFYENVILCSSLVDVYGKCMVIRDSHRMFDEIMEPNAITWNVIVRRYLEVGKEKEAVLMFFKLIQSKVNPLSFTISNALIACSRTCAFKEGIQIHGVAIRIGFEDMEVVFNSLIDMYVKCRVLEDACRIFDQPCSKNLFSSTSIVSGYANNGRIGEARQLFDDMKERSVISWNVMLAGYVHFFHYEEALNFISLMRKMAKDVDSVTLGLILNVCAGLSDIELGKQVHGFIFRSGFYSNLFVGNALLDMYWKCGNLRSSRLWFRQMGRSRDRVSWNALITGYARHRLSEEAMTIFGEMLWETSPSEFTFGSLLAACANLFLLEQGKQIHGFMIRKGYNIDIVARGALIDMYSKCHYIDYALKAFKEAASRDLIMWNSMIFGCCHNGKGKEVIELFRLMEEEGTKPDHVTFQGLLLACICEGYVDLGRQYLNSMSSKYCIIPRLEHYESIIELYSNYGFMIELEDFVKGMPFEPTVPMLRRVFDACREYGHLGLGEWAAQKLNESNPSVPSGFEAIEPHSEKGENTV